MQKEAKEGKKDDKDKEEEDSGKQQDIKMMIHVTH